MGFFIGIACPWLVLAVLETLSQRRARELAGPDLILDATPSTSAYLAPTLA